MNIAVDTRVENTSVEMILRRAQQRLRHRHGAPPIELEQSDLQLDENAPFRNIDLPPDFYFQLDYAAQIFDPRTVPGNTRLYGFKKFLQRLMRVFTTRQVEFNATVIRLFNKFFDAFHDVMENFTYFRNAEVNLTRRLEHNEKQVGNLFSLYEHQRQRVEDCEAFDQELTIQRRRLENVERYEEELNQVRSRIERVEGWESRLNGHRERLERVEGFERDLYQHRKRLERVEGYERELNLSRDRIEQLEETTRQLNRRLRVLEDLEQRLEHALAENTVLRQRLDRVVAHGVSKPPARTAAPPAVAEPQPDVAREELLNDHLYFPYLNEDRAIEDVIRERVKRYMPFFRAQKPIAGIANPYIIDIGCGRGEFLDMCRKVKIAAHGIDINEDMVAHCRAKGHEVELSDAIPWLEGIANDSLGGLIACHVIEHMQSHALLHFLRLCMMKLAPGGRMVLETPNPKTLFAISMFFRDFTHERPVHPHTLAFLLKQLGFNRVEVEEINRAPESLTTDIRNDPVMSENMTKLDDIVYGYLDYCVMAVK